MNKDKAIQLLERLQDPEPYEPMLTKDAYDAIQMAIDALSADGDTISRKAAIEAINKALDRQTLLNRFVRKVAIDAIKQLPPTQPEIIRCKDCKHRWTHKCMDSMPIERCDLEQTFYDAEVDYCSLAERREVTT